MKDGGKPESKQAQAMAGLVVVHLSDHGLTL